jgi:hypothetical protein
MTQHFWSTKKVFGRLKKFLVDQKLIKSTKNFFSQPKSSVYLSTTKLSTKFEIFVDKKGEPLRITFY